MNVHDFTVIDNKHNNVELSRYKGKVLLIVNTATGCGLTPQYEALEKLYRTYKDKGFEILDFPCNQFREQAKGSDEEINQFCTLTYDTTFPRFSKIDVNGPATAPLFEYLKAQKSTGTKKGNILMRALLCVVSKLNGRSCCDGDIKWNFTKFLVDQNGNVVERFEPTVTAEFIEPAIKKLL